jgi:two-component sensor histidine kinase
VEVSERRQAEEKVKQSLREKETLIRELYHRTKNTMQVIRSMVMLQAAEYATNKEVQLLVNKIEHRVQAISLVHQMLYTSQDLSRISIKEYILELASLILTSFGIPEDRVTVHMNIEDQYFLLDTAIPFGLLLNELMINSLKYAFPNGRKGIITINLTKKNSDKNILEYSDNGVGVPDEFDFRNQNTLGLKLIYGIVESQMMGKVIFKNNNGVNCFAEISTKLYEERV